MAETNVADKPKDETPGKVEPAKDKTPEETLDEEIAVFEPVEKAVDRKLTYLGDTRTYVQHEMGFLTKLKFFRLLAKTIRLSASDDEGGVSEFLNEFFSPGAISNQNAMVTGLLQLIEHSPEFIEEAYCYALSVPLEEQAWAYGAFETLSDDEGLDILDVFVAQNGKAMRDFFTQKLPKIGKRLQTMIGQEKEQ